MKGGVRVVNDRGSRVVEKVQQRRLVLPNEVKYTLGSIEDRIIFNSYLAVLNDAGWTLQCLGTAICLTREAVRLRVGKVDKYDKQRVRDLPELYQVPVLPVKEVIETFHIPIAPKPEDVKRLLELKPFAQAVRSNSPKFRKEAEEYTALMYRVLSEGVTVYQLAKAIGVTRVGISTRLIRYGYTEKVYTKSEDKIYKKINEGNRAKI